MSEPLHYSGDIGLLVAMAGSVFALLVLFWRN